MDFSDLARAFFALLLTLGLVGLGAVVLRGLAHCAPHGLPSRVARGGAR